MLIPIDRERKWQPCATASLPPQDRLYPPTVMPKSAISSLNDVFAAQQYRLEYSPNLNKYHQDSRSITTGVAQAGTPESSQHSHQACHQSRQLNWVSVIFSLIGEPELLAIGLLRRIKTASPHKSMVTGFSTNSLKAEPSGTNRPVNSAVIG